MAATVVTIDRDKYKKAAGPFGIYAFISGFRVTTSHFFRNLVGWIRGKPTVATWEHTHARMMGKHCKCTTRGKGGKTRAACTCGRNSHTPRGRIFGQMQTPGEPGAG